jgi:superfamily II DNA helicase RecQ
MGYFARLEKDPDRSNLLRSNARQIETYINTRTCRRLPLLRHFDPYAKSSVTATPKCCDNCDRVSTTTDFFNVEEANFATDSAIVFECLADFLSKPSRTMLQLHIRGSKAKQLKPEMHSKPSWGKGKLKLMILLNLKFVFRQRKVK